MRAMLIALFSGIQWVYAAIKQIRALCTQMDLSARPPERVRAPANSMAYSWEVTFSKPWVVFSATAESERPNLKELQHAASKKKPIWEKKGVAKLCFLVSRFLSKPSQVLCGYSRQLWSASLLWEATCSFSGCPNS